MKNMQLSLEGLSDQFSCFPGTRYMGSKKKIVPIFWKLLREYKFDSFFDAFAGSNVVGYFMKVQGKQVITNDFMSISHAMSKAIIENTRIRLSQEDVDFLINNVNKQTYIANTFGGLYFSDHDNHLLDRVRFNISLLSDEYKQSIALSALVRACMKKRPRGIFTFVGDRYDDGRKDIKTTLEAHFIENIALFNNAIFDNHTPCMAYNELTQELEVKADLVYLDPPYFTPNSDNDYVRRYHFVEGLVRNWKGLTIQEHTKTKKFKSYSSPFAKREETYIAFENLIRQYKDSIIVISYSSNSLPTKKEIVAMLQKHKDEVLVHEIDYTYSFGNQKNNAKNSANRVKEYLFIGR